MRQSRLVLGLVGFAVVGVIANRAQAKKTDEVPIETDLVYATVDGIDLEYDIARPVEGEGPFPLIVCIHAGGWHLGDKKSYTKRYLQKLAARGYVAATVNYRMAPDYHWPAQIEDVQRALRHFRSRAPELNIDPNRVGAVGADAGGHLALMLGLLGAKEEKDTPPERSLRIQAVVNCFGGTDLREEIEVSAWVQTQLLIAFGKKLDKLFDDFVGSDDRSGQAYADASPITHVTPDAPPILSIYGSKDPIVDEAQPKAFHDALSKAGVEEELMIIEGAAHHLDSLNKNDDEADKRMFEFLDRHLKGKVSDKTE